MKKILLCASALAILAGCAEDEFESVRNESTKGISFAATIDNGAETKGELTLGEQIGFFWYAETDKINVFAKENVTGKGVISDWSTLTSTTPAAEYKATKSAGKGEFTAVDNANLITFSEVPTNAQIESMTTTFVATYASTVSAVATDEKSGDITTVTIKPEESNAAITLTAANTNISGFMPLYSVSKAYPTESYHSVGEKVDLKFYRPFATLGLVASGVAEYSKLFGKLQKVTVTTLGGEDQGAPIEASKISYGTDTEYEINVANPGDLTKTKVKTEGALGTSIVITYGTGVGDNATGLEWADGRGNALLFPALSVDRSNFREKNKKESYTVKYEFENITFTVEDETNEDWNAFNKSNAPIVKALKGLNVADYKFLVTNKNDLIVNSGNFADIYEKGSSKAMIDWGESGVAVDQIKSIVSKVPMTAVDLGDLKNFDALTSLKLTECTEIPAHTFTNAQATAMISLELPAVTSIDKQFVGVNQETGGAFSGLTNLNLAAYEFPEPDINRTFFNDNTKSSIGTLDISAVKSMIPAFGVLRELSFVGFTALENVKVYEGVQLSANAFKGCTSLAKINGTVKINGAVSAFDGCKAEGFKTISIIGTDIPDYAFNGCTNLVGVTVNGEQVVPTKVGEKAFAETGITHMDLTNVTTLGKNAFNGCKLMSSNNETQILTVGAAAIPEGAFAGTAVVMVDFTKATSIQKDILKNANSLEQVRFNEKFTVAAGSDDNYWKSTFGNIAGVNLFVAEGQQYVSSNKLELPYGTGASAGFTILTFKGIYNN